MAEIICAACNAAIQAAPRCPECDADPLLDARYRLLAVVGRGGVGVTFRAQSVADDRVVAIKEMPFRATDADEVRKLIEREARVLRQLEHPAVPTYHDDFIAGQGRQRAFYLVQEFVEGHDLADELERKRYTTADVLDIVESLCDVLAYLHALHPPVIHRDIKTRNVMRRPDGRLVLLDFGAVRDVVNDPRMGGSTVAGTFGYMAPEQFAGQATPATDLYALGVLAVVLLSRRQPDEMLDVQRLDWRPHVQVKAPVESLLTWLLEPDPSQRAGSAEAVKARIERVRAQLDGRAPLESPNASRRLPGHRVIVTEPTRPSPPTSLAPNPNGGYWASERTDAAPPATFAVSPYDAGTSAPVAALPNAARAKTKQMTLLMAILAGGLGGPFWYLGHHVLGFFSLFFFWTFIPWVASVAKAIQVNALSDLEFDRRYNSEALALRQAMDQSMPDRLERLHALREKGALTDAEFDRQKQRLLDD